MSNARKLQTEIDRVMKKVDEGVDLFDEIWDKVYSAEQQNQKEKFEMDLKKEIKKLQRLRDQIKSWISSSDVKDKDPLFEARKLIETKMEAFKFCEKETKTKAYSKEGLTKAAEKLTPEELAKIATCQWISLQLEQFTVLIEERELEVEKLSAGRGKKTNKHVIEECNGYLRMHKYHVMTLEGIIRLVNNDVLDVIVVDPIKEDLEYYIESHEDPEFLQTYVEEYFYEALGLEELQVVNVDHVTQAEICAEDNKGKGKKGGKAGRHKEEDETRAKGSEKGTKKTKKGHTASNSSAMPLVIGRARKGGKKEATAATTRSGLIRKGSIGNVYHTDESQSGDDDDSFHNNNNSTTTTVLQPGVVLPVATHAPSGTAPGSSMAAILKRETEQQEKERQAKVAEQLRLQQQAVAAAALRQQQQQQQQQQAEQLRLQQEAQLLQQRQQQEVAAKQMALQEQQQLLQQQQQQQQVAAVAQATALRQQQEATLRQQQQQQQQAQQQELQQHAFAAQQKAAQAQQQAQVPGGSVGGGGSVAGQQEQQNASKSSSSVLGNNSVTSPGLVGSASHHKRSMSGDVNSLLGNNSNNNSNSNSTTNNGNGANSNNASPAGGAATAAGSGGGGTNSNNGILQETFATLPQSNEHDRTTIRSNSYTPQNPYPATPASYPTQPNAIFENPAIFEKLGTDALFYIFYYKQGSYQQYLAARELKKQSWRFHKKYMTWFQRHEEPKITTDEYEQGTYVYFDWETGWCTRIKQDFRFEYSFLEDTLQ